VIADYVTHVRQGRLAAGWVYQADKAAKNPNLTRGQVAYAITMRATLARQFVRDAAAHSIANFTPAGNEWLAIGAACRKEVKRMERADARLGLNGGSK
jgi:hypothetical protein